MKLNKIFSLISLIIIFSMVAGSTTSLAQMLLSTAQAQVDPAVPLWRQVNINGFGDLQNAGVLALEIFNGRLYASSSNYQIGAKVWRLETNGSWTAVSEPGFGSAYANINRSIPDMTVFNGYLYAGTGWAGLNGQVWRTPNGTTWSQVAVDGFGNAHNFLVSPFGIFDGFIYAGTNDTTDGLEIWRSATGDLGDWDNVVIGGNGNPHNYIVTNFTEFGDNFYAAIENQNDGAEIWRTDDGSTWSAASIGGLGDPNNTQTGGMTIYEGYLYVGTRNDATGAQLFRSKDGTTWEPMIEDGFGDANNIKIEMIDSWNGSLIVGVDNLVTGVEIWQSSDGMGWNQINHNGFGDSKNIKTLWNSSTIEFDQHIYLGTENQVTGGEIWQLYLGYPIYLPAVKR